jgi:hypothetical protein
MASSREEEIRQRAHAIWEREGRPDGKEMDHWTRAERELTGEIPGGTQTQLDAPMNTGARQAAGPAVRKAVGARPAARRPAAAPK